MNHIHVNICETMRDGYHVCDKCKSKTMLVSALSCWSVDQEAFKADERTDDDPEVADEVEIREEVTGHYCPECERLTSFCVST